jgi:hypothetical protein
MLGRGTFSSVISCRDLSAPHDDDNSSVSPENDITSGNSGSDDDRSTSPLVVIPRKPNNMFAIKVIRDVARYRHAAEKEARILQYLASSKHHPYHPARPRTDLQTARGYQQDSISGVYGVNPLLGWFRLNGHMCMVRKVEEGESFE